MCIECICVKLERWIHGEILILKKIWVPSQHPHDYPPPSGTPAPGYGLLGHQAHVWCTYSHTGKHSCTENKKKYNPLKKCIIGGEKKNMKFSGYGGRNQRRLGDGKNMIKIIHENLIKSYQSKSRKKKEYTCVDLNYLNLMNQTTSDLGF